MALDLSPFGLLRTPNLLPAICPALVTTKTTVYSGQEDVTLFRTQFGIGEYLVPSPGDVYIAGSPCSSELVNCDATQTKFFWINSPPPEFAVWMGRARRRNRRTIVAHRHVRR